MEGERGGEREREREREENKINEQYKVKKHLYL
jgi:hypothetical protein